MVNGRHLENRKIRHISATVQPIAAKFRKVMHIAPSTLSTLGILSAQKNKKPSKY